MANRSGYRIHIHSEAGETQQYASSWFEVCDVLFHLRDDRKVMAVFDLTYPNPHLVLIHGAINGTNQIVEDYVFNASQFTDHSKR